MVRPRGCQGQHDAGTVRQSLTPHTIEVFNAKKLAIGMLARPDAAHPKPGCDVKLGDYVQLSDQNWTKVLIPRRISKV